MGKTSSLTEKRVFARVGREENKAGNIGRGKTESPTHKRLFLNTH
jgi:hypothetical protein